MVLGTSPHVGEEGGGSLRLVPLCRPERANAHLSWLAPYKKNTNYKYIIMLNNIITCYQ